ncbi:hypothetical protein AX16_010960 [Volvariella volvacea WC 439]|nr:hypothetical protein AX16_010960 [Volvariella volvacea WC 439]
MTTHYSACNNSRISNTGGSMITTVGSHNTVNGNNYSGMRVSGDYHSNNYHGRAEDRRIYNNGGNNQVNMDNSKGSMFNSNATSNDVNMELLEHVRQLNQQLDDANEKIERLNDIIDEYERRFGKI